MVSIAKDEHDQVRYDIYGIEQLFKFYELINSTQKNWKAEIIYKDFGLFSMIFTWWNL